MKRVLLWIAGIVVALVVVVVLAFRFSPWPSVALIEYAFSKGDAASEERLARHVPPGIGSRLDIAYGSGPDERLDVFREESATGPQPAVVWIHGGGWIAGSKQGVSNYLRVLAGQGYTMFAVEYSTGYGGTYPTPVRQVNAALGYVVGHAAELGIDPTRLVVAGDSAGAQLTSQLAILTTDPAYASELGIAPTLTPRQLAGVILVSGAYDIEGVDRDGDFGWFLNTVLWAYSGVRDFMADPSFLLASVAQHTSPAFPPAFITSGNADPLGPQAVAFAKTLADQGVKVDSLFFPADYQPPLEHEYQFNLDLEAGQQSFDRIVAFLRQIYAAG